MKAGVLRMTPTSCLMLYVLFFFFFSFLSSPILLFPLADSPLRHSPLAIPLLNWRCTNLIMSRRLLFIIFNIFSVVLNVVVTYGVQYSQ